MSVYEKKLAKARLLKAARAKEYLFRTPAGQAWVGRHGRLNNGTKVIHNPTVVKLLPNGTPDYCGFKSVTVTPEMVGKQVAIFICEEHKATKSDRMRPDQIRAKKVIVKSGGIHRIVKHDETVIEECLWSAPSNLAST